MNPINAATASANQPQDPIRPATALADSLKNLNVTNPQFAISRDPETALFVILVRDRDTGYLLDQLPSEDIVKRGVDAGLSVIL